MRKKALMATNNYWSSPFQVGSHHIAKSLLSMGWEVAFISNPISPLHTLRGLSQDLRERYKLYREKNSHSMHLWPYVPGTCFTPYDTLFLRTHWVHENWQRFSLPNVIKEASAHGFGKVDLLYLDSSLQAFWLDQLIYKKSVLRIADHTPSFRSIAQAAFAQEKKMAQRVDAVVYTADSLEPYVKKLQPKEMVRIANGVNFKHFTEGTWEMPQELKEIDKPIILYVGAIAEWFDYELLNALTAMMPDLAFVMVGPDEMARERLVLRDNLYLLGRKPYEIIPGFMHHANVGVIPFNKRDYPELINGVNPLKMYEYLACGLAVVATRWDELERLKSPANLCDTPEEFAAAIRRALQEQQDKRPERIAYAQRFDWLEITKDLMHMLDV